jgi:hypothetical protein
LSLRKDGDRPQQSGSQNQHPQSHCEFLPR